MRSLLVILAVGGVSYHFCDVRSAHWAPRLLFPFIFSMCLVALVFWLYVKSRNSRDRGNGNDSGGFSFSGGGDDGGGGDGGD